MSKLEDLIQEIQYEDSWGIWADVPFRQGSSARCGQMIFENGGALDDKEFFATGRRCGDFLAKYCPRDDEGYLEDTLEGALELIDEIEAERQEEERYRLE